MRKMYCPKCNKICENYDEVKYEIGACDGHHGEFNYDYTCWGCGSELIELDDMNYDDFKNLLEQADLDELKDLLCSLIKTKEEVIDTLHRDYSISECLESNELPEECK